MDSLKGTLTPMKVLSGRLNGGIAYGTFNYNELENKPSVNGHELVGNVNIPIPTKTSDLTNDSGFITDADIPTKTSELTNDSGFITSADIPTIPTNTSQLNNDSGFLTMNTTPVWSVNSQTGDVNLFIPKATSQLKNDSGFLTMNTTPVRSVNLQTGDVNLFIPKATSQLDNDSGFITEEDIPTPVKVGTIENVSIASFSDGADNVPVSELIVDIEARQEGSGTPSPDNVRAISGFDSGLIRVNGNQVSNVYTVDFGQTVYGGRLNVTTGELTITHGYIDLGSLAWTLSIVGNNRNRFNGGTLTNVRAPASNGHKVNGICSVYEIQSANYLYSTSGAVGLDVEMYGNLQVYDNSYNDATAFKTAMNGQILVYELAAPQTIQLTPVQVKTLLNNNNIFANTGNIEKLVYFKTGCEAIATLIEAYGEKDGIQTVLLEASDWDSTTNTITVDVAGVTATSNQEIFGLRATSAANIANNKALQACNLMDYGQAEGQITLYAENIPSVDLSIRVIVRA